MLETSFSTLASAIGITGTTLLALIVIWDLAWRCVGVWKSTQNNQPIWSVLFVLLQTIGILPILYIFIFSKKRNSSIKPIRIKSKKRIKKKK